MNARCAVVLAACMAGCLMEVRAGQPIEGAFGARLGDVLDTSSYKSNSVMCWFQVNETTSQERSVPVYALSRTNAPSVFYSVYVEITPRSRKVYRITAEGNDLSAAEREALLASLRGKYESTVEDPKSPDKVVNQGNRYIRLISRFHNTIYVNVPPSRTSQLTYTDEELLKQAIKERAEMLFDKDSGL